MRPYLVLATGCWAAAVEPRPIEKPAPAPVAKAVLGRDLIIAGSNWRYDFHVTVLAGSKRTEERGEFPCAVTEVVPWLDTARAGTLECERNLADIDERPGFDPLGGVWARTPINDGLWRLDGPLLYEQFIVAEEETKPLESVGLPIGVTRTYRRGSQWCRREERDDLLWIYELCFDRSGITSGELRHQESWGQRTVTFERQ